MHHFIRIYNIGPTSLTICFLKEDPRHQLLPTVFGFPVATVFHDQTKLEMDWAQDFCLSCDKQTSGEAYCSQACRLVDIEQSAGSAPSSPSTMAPPVSWSPGPSTGSGFYLPPPLDFNAYKPSKKEQLPPLQSTSRSSLSYTLPTQPTSMSSSSSAANRAITPSSSQSSLSSMGSTSTQEGCLSDKARMELRGYASSFDQVRDWKRRMTTP